MIKNNLHPSLFIFLCVGRHIYLQLRGGNSQNVLGYFAPKMFSSGMFLHAYMPDIESHT